MAVRGASVATLGQAIQSRPHPGRAWPAPPEVAPGHGEHHVEPREQTRLVAPNAASLRRARGNVRSVGLELGVAAPLRCLQSGLCRSWNPRRIREVLGHQPPVDEDHVVPTRRRATETRSPISSLWFRSTLRGPRPRVARDETADRTGGVQRAPYHAPGVSFPGTSGMIGKHATSTSCFASRYARSAADLIVPPLRGSTSCRGVRKRTVTAGPIEHREEGEGDGRSHDPGEPPRFERQPPHPLEPERWKARGARRLEPGHMSNAPPTPIMTRTDERVRMARDPPLLLRRAESDEHDRRRRRSGSRRSSRPPARVSRRTVLVHPDASPGDDDLQAGSCPPPSGHASANVGAPPTNATVSPLLGREPDEERRDLDARPGAAVLPVPQLCTSVTPVPSGSAGRPSGSTAAYAASLRARQEDLGVRRRSGTSGRRRGTRW